MKISEEKRMALSKRLADFMEKGSIACFAVGIFQGDNLGLLVGSFCLVVSAVVTYLEA